MADRCDVRLEALKCTVSGDKTWFCPEVITVYHVLGTDCHGVVALVHMQVSQVDSVKCD